MKISDIIAEADILVPNDVPMANKLVQLNAINQDFFNVVKVPKIARFTTLSGQIGYALPEDIRSKNIDKVQVASFRYQSIERDDIIPTQNGYSFDDDTHMLSLYPAPYDALPSFLRYHKIATKTFTNSAVATDEPDAALEYHWTYIAALAAYIAKTQDDGIKAGNFETQYKAAWNVAAQNYLQTSTGADAQ